MSDEERSRQLEELQARLGLRFKDLGLLEQSLVHRSLLRDTGQSELQSNERLEFLGDAVIGQFVARYLFDRLPNATEGELTLLRTWLVRASTLGDWAVQLDLERYLRLGRSDERSTRRTRLLARTFEAVVGAIYADQGIRGVNRFLRPLVEQELRRRGSGAAELDSKSRLQQVTQGRFDLMPVYEVLSISGPGHDPTFTVEVRVGEHVRLTAEGSTKQGAEQLAARLALEQLEAQVSASDGRSEQVAEA